jgi:hypothetical protein
VVERVLTDGTSARLIADVVLSPPVVESGLLPCSTPTEPAARAHARARHAHGTRSHALVGCARSPSATFSRARALRS